MRRAVRAGGAVDSPASAMTAADDLYRQGSRQRTDREALRQQTPPTESHPATADHSKSATPKDHRGGRPHARPKAQPCNSPRVEGLTISCERSGCSTTLLCRRGAVTPIARRARTGPENQCTSELQLDLTTDPGERRRTCGSRLSAPL